MNRPWKAWLVFCLALVVLVAALAWMTRNTLQLDYSQAQAQQQAEFEETVRLALWRLDSWLVPLIVAESARPYYLYESVYAADRAYPRSSTTVAPGDIPVPSPLLDHPPAAVQLYFQFAPGEALTSPQVPTRAHQQAAPLGEETGVQRQALASRLARLDGLLRHNFTNQFGSPRSLSTPLRPGSRSEKLEAPPILLNREYLASLASEPLLKPGRLDGFRLLGGYDAQFLNSPAAQYARTTIEQSFRHSVYQQARLALSAARSPRESGADIEAREGPMRPVWVGGELLLARRVDREKDYLIQGCWLDWTNLNATLRANIQDLFPGARLQPVTTPRAKRDVRMLAALPVRLDPGATPFAPLPEWSPIRAALVLDWLAIALAGTAMALLLHGALSLSERRAAFVSAVTHELRTPLTTFKMYSEMLADGLVKDPEKQRQYLATLCAEANRLGHLVENVLAYARLERAPGRSRLDRLTLEELLRRVEPRLRQRTSHSGCALHQVVAPDSLPTVMQVDAAAVEQILFNLIDNACKYGVPQAEQKVIHLEACANGNDALLRVRDHGGGIPADVASRLFQPFSKSAHDAALSAPGIGLGLALCRRWSRSLGGDLQLDGQSSPGACFVLKLPLHPPRGWTRNEPSIA